MRSFACSLCKTCVLENSRLPESAMSRFQCSCSRYAHHPSEALTQLINRMGVLMSACHAQCANTRIPPRCLSACAHTCMVEQGCMRRWKRG